MPNYAKVKLTEGSRLKLESGRTLMGEGPHELRLRMAHDGNLLEAYRAGRIEILEGGQYLRENAEGYKYSGKHWRSLKNEIIDGEHDDELDLIEAEDGRDSIQEAVDERRRSL